MMATIAVLPAFVHGRSLGATTNPADSDAGLHGHSVLAAILAAIALVIVVALCTRAAEANADPVPVPVDPLDQAAVGDHGRPDPATDATISLYTSVCEGAADGSLMTVNLKGDVQAALRPELWRALKDPACQVTELSLEANGLRAEDGKAIGKAPKANESITHLNLCDNYLGAKGVADIGEALKNNTSTPTSISRIITWAPRAPRAPRGSVWP